MVAKLVMKIEAITLREIHMPLVHFFETSFGRIYSRRILLVTIRCEGVDGWGESVAGEDPFYSSEWIESAWPTLTQYLIPAMLGKHIESSRDCPSLFARVTGHRMGKAALEEAVVEVAGRVAARDSLRRFHWNPGFDRAIAGKNPDRIGCRLSPHQGQSQARLGPERARTHPLALGRHYIELRRKFCLHARSGRASARLRSVQSSDDRAAPME